MNIKYLFLKAAYQFQVTVIPINLPVTATQVIWISGLIVYFFPDPQLNFAKELLIINLL